LPVTVLRSDGVLEYWSDGLITRELYASENFDALCLRLQKIGVGFSFFQYSITPTLHKYFEQNRVMESLLQGGKSMPGPLGQDSLRLRLLRRDN
jgi:hypothetical protein